ncbi:uncharacterized protein LOC128740150 [Sabethes cyaneus]|uniref:uncharacterized protein LOC128740150 n=1 Tax=Sabethes cyaneus TaxID=53552 RepID=UPI00237D6A3A|nr:uncharacterized protein LOC128740150 [Sabethes cyaneus]
MSTVPYCCCERATRLGGVFINQGCGFIQGPDNFHSAKSDCTARLQANPVESQPPIQPRRQTPRPVASHGAVQINSRKCVSCGEHHPLYLCTTFSTLNLEDKEREIQRYRLCRNCPRQGHLAKDCLSTRTCRKCGSIHHTQLCLEKTAIEEQASTSAVTTNYPSTSVVSATIGESANDASIGLGRKTILLATAIVIIIDNHGVEHAALALLDSRSECCFMTESFSQLIKAQRKKIHLPIAGIGQSATHARHKLHSTIRSCLGKYTRSLDFLILSKVTIDIPSTSVDVSSWEMPPGIQLADPSFHRTRSIDLVLGAEIFFNLFNVAGRISLDDNPPVLVNSVLGWIVSESSTCVQPTTPIVIVANVATIQDLHALMERFWSIEEDEAGLSYSVEEAACEEHFRRIVTRNSKGRHVVRLTIKQDLCQVLSNLVDNRRSVLRRSHQLEARLVRNPDQYHQYRAFLEEYYMLGHMQRVFDHENPPTPCYHLPHHAVIRAESTTTKLRVVFDASSSNTWRPFAQRCTHGGPYHTRRPPFNHHACSNPSYIADIKQMYRQVLVDDRDTPPQRIVWRSSSDSPMETYELKTVTYVKAIHIELVGDLSTGSFIAALRRFLARRGKPRLIECDNATNFKGASRELAELKRQFNSQQMQQSITSSCTEEGIEFKFIPPRSPNFGGLWEAAVKSLKAHLRATIGNAVLTAEQLTTLLAPIESCLNSRPLTQMTAEPEDLEVLTPGHFLIHRSLTAPAEPSLENVPINRLDRWQVVQEYVRRLWRRWSTEYLSGLQPRTKWTREKDNIAIGTMVLVKEENLPPLKWRFGRIVHIFRADDGNIRVVVRAVTQKCTDNGIRWHFNPPKTSNFGGLWEAAIASAQKHFVRVLGTHTLACDSMTTLLAQIECCLNFRPIVPLSDDPSDLEPLTPGHFLTGAALKSVPDNNFSDVPFNRLRQWQQTQKLFSKSGKDGIWSIYPHFNHAQSGVDHRYKSKQDV